MLRAPRQIRLQIVQQLRHLRGELRSRGGGVRGLLHQRLNVHAQDVREELRQILAHLPPDIGLITAGMQLVTRTLEEPGVRQTREIGVGFEHQKQGGQRTKGRRLEHQSQLQRTNTGQQARKRAQSNRAVVE